MRNFGLAVTLGLSVGVSIALSCGPASRGPGNGDDDGSNGSNGSNGQCTGGSCSATCEAANMNHSSVGCEYYAIDMDGAAGPPYDACFAVFVANVSTAAVHINVDWGGQAIDLAQFAKLPQGTGTSLTYGAYDPAAGLSPGQVAILFLDYNPASIIFGNVACPVPAALAGGVQVHGTGVGTAFHITTDTPVVAYQMLPYGGGKAAATGASLLIPTSAWQQNYIAVGAYDVLPAPPINIPGDGPSHNIVAAVDHTTVTIRPKSAIAAGSGVPAGTANTPWTMTLDKGQYVQLTQTSPLSGSPITSSAPVGVFGGHPIMSIDRCCGDHGEQMLTPVSALGSTYVAAPHPDREPGSFSDPRVFRIYGAVDGTQLTYDPPGVGAASVNLGDQIEIRTAAPFTVSSQDSDHPFSMFTYMTGAGDGSGSDASWVGGYGDPDFVRLVPPPQYLGHYVFFTDPTYPFTALTVVRQKVNNAFADVTLTCMGTIPAADWKPVGTTGNYQIAHEMIVDNFTGQHGCNNGVNIMDSANPFGLWVWGWGSDETSPKTGWVSYGYPAGEAVLPINDVVIE